MLAPWKERYGSILKSRDIVLLTNIYIVKTVAFPVVMYGCESWTIRKAEHKRNDLLFLFPLRSKMFCAFQMGNAENNNSSTMVTPKCDFLTLQVEQPRQHIKKTETLLCQQRSMSSKLWFFQ